MSNNVFVPGFSSNALGLLYRDSDGSGPYGVDRNRVPYLIGGGALAAISSAALVSSLVLKASAGRLNRVQIHNSAAAAQYYQLFDATARPANGAAPVAVIAVPAGGDGVFDYGVGGRPFANGIVVTNSSTAATLTAGAADSYFDGTVS